MTVEVFQINSFIRGIRTHRDVAVLFSTGDSVYMDGKGWEPDNDLGPVFSYTGEGLRGDQAMKGGNLFLKNSVGKKVYLFVQEERMSTSSTDRLLSKGWRRRERMTPMEGTAWSTGSSSRRYDVQYFSGIPMILS